METDRQVTRDAMQALVASVKRARELKDYDQVEALLGIAESTFQLQRFGGDADPVVAASLAEITNDPERSISLYELALSQSARYPSDPTYSWRIALGARLFGVHKDEDAIHHLNRAREDAVAGGDRTAVEKIDSLMVGRSNKSLERTREG